MAMASMYSEQGGCSGTILGVQARLMASWRVDKAVLHVYKTDQVVLKLSGVQCIDHIYLAARADEDGNHARPD